MSLVERNLLANFDQQSQNDSVEIASKNLLHTLGIKIVSQGTVPDSGAVLLISNHPGSLDNHAIMSTSKRADLHVVALASYSILGFEYEKKLLPIYGKRRAQDIVTKILLNDLGSHTLKDEKIAKIRNRETIDKAAEIISDGGSVAMFPTGAGGNKPENGSWKSGIGHLVGKITNKKTQLVFANVKGGIELDIFRYLDTRLRKVLFNNKIIEVKYSKPVLLFDSLEISKNGKKNTQALESLYKKRFK